VIGHTADGTAFTIRLTGPGNAQLAVASTNSLFALVVRNGTAANQLTITTARSGTGLSLNDLLINGDLGAVSAPTTDVTSLVQVTGHVGSLSLRDAAEVHLGGSAGQKSSLFFRDLSGDLTSTSSLALLWANGIDSGTLDVPTIGKLITTPNPAAGLFGDVSSNLTLDAGSTTASALGSATISGGIYNSTWDVRGSVGSVTAQSDVVGWQLGTAGDGYVHPNGLGAVGSIKAGGSFADSAIVAGGAIGSISVGEWSSSSLTALALAGLSVGTDLSGATLTLTGSAGAGKVGLGTVQVNGAVQGSTFNVQAGNVTTFRSASFKSSNLYVGYTPGLSFDQAGLFLGSYKLGSFTTTAVPPADAFADSQVVAGRFGKITLSGVTTNNSGKHFGLRVNGSANAGKVTLRGAPISPGSTHGDFEFLAA
jgi:hypothetical protein